MNKSIFCVIGQSGSGKTTIVTELCNKYGFKQTDSYCTRPKRSENEQGHIFVNQEAFDKLKPYIVAYKHFNGFDYGVTKQQIDNCDLYVVDYDGLCYLKKHYKGNKNIVSIFIDTTMEERISRMFDRGDMESSVIDRLINDKKEFENVKDKCDYIVRNEDFNVAIKLIYEIIKKEINL